MQAALYVIRNACRELDTRTNRVQLCFQFGNQITWRGFPHIRLGSCPGLLTDAFASAKRAHQHNAWLGERMPMHAHEQH